MSERLQKIWSDHPLAVIMILAAISRLLAAVFSKGYAMSDDHFVVIHVAQRWLDGYYDWFNQDHPSGFSLVYTGIHYILFFILKQIGITDPQLKMYIVRFLHAAYSLLTVYFGYKITELLADRKTANLSGLLLGLLWFLPFMAVRNLIEMVCVPAIMIGYFLGLSGDQRRKKHYWLYAGIVFGLTFAIRYQTLLIPGGIGLVLLLQRDWPKFLWFTTGMIFGLLVLQGLVDWIAWGYPFAAFIQYFVYNIDNRYNYIVGPWYKYLLLLSAVLIPPVSFFLLYGFSRTWKKYALLFWPVLIFLIFHSYFPNKQERFILPIVPLIIIVGVIGWQQFVAGSTLQLKWHRLIHGSWRWFWIVNTVLLVILTLTYSKRTMVEPMIYLAQKEDIKAVVINYDGKNMPWFPRFYFANNARIYRFSKDITPEKFTEMINKNPDNLPNYFYFYGQNNLEKRVNEMQQLLNIRLNYYEKINPSLIDRIMHLLNPRHNLNLTGHIYKVPPQ